MKGKFYLKRIKNVLIFGVLEMDERFRVPSNKINNSFTASNGMRVTSSDNPQVGHVDNMSVFLRGKNKKWDTPYTSESFLSEEEAISVENKIRQALREWAEKWKGWKTKDSESEPVDVFKV